MIDRAHDLPSPAGEGFEHQPGRRLLQPRSVSIEDLAIMRRIDELHLEHPFMGAGCCATCEPRRRRDRPPPCRDADEAYGDRGDLSTPEHQQARAGDKIYPYLLRKLKIERANHVWAMDITYIPMARGFVYLAAVVDWATRRVLSHRVSITMEADFCVEALEEALVKYGKPEIFNTDQGSQFTGKEFTGVLTSNAIAISMDGKGSWRDNVFVERLWRSVKYEEVYLRAYGSVGEARASIARYLAFYNERRPHPSLDRRTPSEVYFASRPSAAAA